MEMKPRLWDDLLVYLVMGLDEREELSCLELAEQAIEGGATMIQLREKNAPLSRVLEEGRALARLCKSRNIPFLVNDRVDVALLLDADGVHVGQDDIPCADVRALIGPGKIIGVSAGTWEEAEQAVRDGADYLGVGSVYSTSTKQDAGEPIGTRLIKKITASLAVPVVGIGGIQASNAEAVYRAGAAGIAVITAITRDKDPAGAASALTSIGRHARTTHK